MISLLNSPPRSTKIQHLLPAIALFFLVCGGINLHGQQWQYVYGGDNTSEDGMRGVTPVTNACRAYPACQSCTTQTDGYIAVGSTYNQATTGDDVYVIRTDPSGAAIWEATYDISGNGDNDQGHSIVQLADGTGFAITGYTSTAQTGINTDLFILKIDCDGAVVWSRTYRGPRIGRDEITQTYGFDIVEATSGTSLFGTRAGDLIVAGSALTNNGQDALLLRTNATGTLIWNTAFDEPNTSNEMFEALIEATLIFPAQTGDIIAAGEWNDGAGSHQAYVVRVDGNTGTIGAAPQGAATYGNTASYVSERFFSLVELQNPNETGTNGQPNVVLAGYGDATNGGVETFLVKLNNGDPCSVLVQTLVGDGDPVTPEGDFATDIQEIPYTPAITTNLAQWDLVITGATSTVSGNSNDDAYLLGIDPGTLRPVANTGQVYFPTGTNGVDRGWSLAIVSANGSITQGVVMCGSTRSDWLRLGDPQDVYMLKTDIALSTGLACEDDYNPGYVNVSGSNCTDPNTNSVLSATTVQTDATSRDWGDPVCTNAGNSGKAVPGTGSRAADEQAAYQVSIFGNPVRTGEELRIAFDGDELPESVEISVANSRGEQILATNRTNVEAGSISLATNGWSAGTYFVTINDRGYRRMLRAVVLD